MWRPTPLNVAVLLGVAILIGKIIDLLSLKDEFTVGDAATFSLALLIAITAFGGFLGGILRSRHPFKMVFCDQPIDIPEAEQANRIFRRKFKGKVGRNCITVRIKTKVYTRIQDIDFRLLDTKFFVFPDADNGSDTAKIIAAKFLDIEHRTQVKAKIDSQGGCSGHFPGPRDWAIGEPLWCDLEIESKKPWCGFLSFRARTDRRATVRRRITIRKPPSPRLGGESRRICDAPIVEGGL